MSEKSHFYGNIKAGGDVIAGDQIKVGSISNSSGISIGTGRKETGSKKLSPLTKFILGLNNSEMVVVTEEKFEDGFAEVDFDGTSFLLLSEEFWNQVKKNTHQTKAGTFAIGKLTFWVVDSEVIRSAVWCEYVLNNIDVVRGTNVNINIK